MNFLFLCLQVIDLLDPNHRKNLQVRWSKNRGFYVENLFVVECETRDDLIAVLEEGSVTLLLPLQRGEASSCTAAQAQLLSLSLLPL